MENIKNFTMKKEEIVKSPKDVILDAVVIESNKTTWANIIKPDKIGKFEDPNKVIVQIKYEYGFDDRVLKGEDTMAYYEKPMVNSNLGKYLFKYGDLQVGQKIKIVFGGDGFGSIKLD